MIVEDADHVCENLKRSCRQIHLAGVGTVGEME